MAPPMEDPRTGAGDGGDDGGEVDVRALKAQLAELRVLHRRTEERQRRTEERQLAIIKTLVAGHGHTAELLGQLLG